MIDDFKKRVVHSTRGIFVADDIAIGLGIAALAGGAGMAGSMASKKKKPLEYKFQADPYYNQAQSKLFPFYSNMLEGNIPEYYKSLGEWNSPELENIIGLGVRDTSKAVSEGLTRRGISRGGIGLASTAPAIADMTTNLRFNSLQNAQANRMKFLGIGSQGLETVGNMALANQAQMNNLGFDMARLNWQNDLTQQANDEAMWGNLASSGIGIAGNIYGINKYTDAMKSGQVPNTTNSPLGSVTGDGLLSTEDMLRKITNPHITSF